MYYSLIYPYLHYCNIVWGNNFDCYLYPLETLQKRAVRNICHAIFLAHSEPLFKNSNLLTLRDIHKYLVLIYMYKNHSNGFVQFSSHGYSTRNASNVRSSYKRLLLSRRSFSRVGPSGTPFPNI